MRTCRMLGLAGLLLGVLGCGGPRTYPVQGRVLFKDGRPLPGGLVVFEPTGGEPRVCARGTIRADGTFRLGTYREDDGAIAGPHRVTVSPPPTLNPSDRLVHPRFEDFERSGLQFTVTAGKNDFTITVEKP